MHEGHRAVNLDHALDRMPHKGAMRLIERIVSADEAQIHCIGINHAVGDYPLRLNGQLLSVTLVELGAQAAAAHASLFNIRGNHTGLLIAIQNVAVVRHEVGETRKNLEIFASQLHFDANGAIYGFRVSDEHGDVVKGRAILKMKGEAE